MSGDTLLARVKVMCSGALPSEGHLAMAKPSAQAANDDDWAKEEPALITAVHHRAHSPEELKAEMVAIDAPVIEEYPDFELYLRALAGASGGSKKFLEEVVIPWAAGDKRNTPDMIRAKWKSHKTSHVGWAYIQKVAAKAKADELAEVPITAAPFTLGDHTLIPPRQHIYGKLTRRFLSSTSAPGGSGKSANAMAEAIAMAANKNLFGVKPIGPLRVLYINGEDPQDENQRRAAAICLHHKVTDGELGGRLHLLSGRDNPNLILATHGRDGVQINQQAFAALARLIAELGIDVLILDPIAAFHRLPENDNVAVGALYYALSRLAEKANIAIELLAHTRKPGLKQTEITVDDGRGASSALGAVRYARVLNRITREEAAAAGIQPDERWRYSRVDNGKSNMARPEKAVWRKMASVPLGNGRDGEPGDEIGVVERWQWPDRAAGMTDADIQAVQRVIVSGNWRSNAQATDWAGYAVAQALDFDGSDKAGKARAREILDALTSEGWLKVLRTTDKNGDLRPFVRVGKLNSMTLSQQNDYETGAEDAYEW
jgi:RecA-family ATPase